MLFRSLEKELVTNPYFLNGDMTGWTLVSGASGIRPYGEVDENGDQQYYWFGGRSGYSIFKNETNMIYDASINKGLVDYGAVNFNYSVNMATFSGDSDRGLTQIIFYDQEMNELLKESTAWSSANSWREITLTGIVPESAVYSQVVFYADRKAGSNNDAYFYAPSLVLSVSDEDAIAQFGGLVVNGPVGLSIATLALLGFAGTRKKKKIGRASCRERV